MSSSSTQFTFVQSSSEQLTRCENIPPLVRESDNFLTACIYEQDGTLIKRPVYPSFSKADTCDFDEAVTRMRELVDGANCPIPRVTQGQVQGYGIGVQLEGTELACVDGDDVIRDGSIDGSFSEIITHLDSWTEKSVSGTGAHIWLKNRLPSGTRQKYGDVLERDEADAEFYDGSKSAQFILLTGETMRDVPVENRHTALDELVTHLNEITTENKKVKTADGVTDGVDSKSRETGHKSVEATPSDVRHTLEYRASQGDSSADKTLRIWDGSQSADDTSALDAEFAMCLLYYCRGGTRLVRMCWEQSNRSLGLERHPHSFDEGDYADYTIASASREWDGSCFERAYYTK